MFPLCSWYLPKQHHAHRIPDGFETHVPPRRLFPRFPCAESHLAESSLHAATHRLRASSPAEGMPAGQRAVAVYRGMGHLDRIRRRSGRLRASFASSYKAALFVGCPFPCWTDDSADELTDAHAGRSTGRRPWRASRSARTACGGTAPPSSTPTSRRCGTGPTQPERPLLSLPPSFALTLSYQFDLHQPDPT